MAEDDLPAPSSLMSSRWSRDNLVTCHPAQLYSGKVLEHIDEDALELLIRDLEKQTGPVYVGAGRMGVLTWDIGCAGADGPFILQVPLMLDEPGARGRAKRDVPRLNVENIRHFAALGLTRFLVEVKDFITLAGDVPAAMFTALPEGHHPISFGRGGLHVELADGELSWLVSLGPRASADLLAEMIAALVYHYEPDAGGGTAITDVFINDGDFHARRRSDGTFDVRLTAARRRETGVGPSLLLLYLIQMMAYEDWSVGGGLTGLPTLAGNPSVAFEGAVRGRRHRFRDLGWPEEDGRREALDWIRDFGRSREGRAYRPWVERFLAGGLPLSFGDDPRERWWRLVALRTKLGVVELRARQDPASSEAASARALRAFVDRLSREIGRVPDGKPGAARINDLGRADLIALLAEAQAPADSREDVADAFFARWPYRSLDHLLAEVPGARALRRLKRQRRIDFGRVVANEDQGTLASLGPPPAEGGAARPLANPELFGALPLAAGPARRGGSNLPDVRGVHGRGPARSAVGLLRPARVDRPGRPLHHQPGVAVPPLRAMDRDVGFSLLARHDRARRADRDRPVPDRRVRRRQRPPRPRRAGRRRAGGRRAVARLRVARAVPDLRNVGVAARQAAPAPRRGRHRRRGRRAAPRRAP